MQDPAALNAVRELASQTGLSMNAVASMLILEALHARGNEARSFALVQGLPVFPAREGQGPVTSQNVQDALDDKG